MAITEHNVLTLLGQDIHPGESKEINFDIANLHTSTPVNVPVIIERAVKPGPIILFTAGIHGDEVNGVEIVRQIISSGINKPTRGTIICMPVINVFGFINLKREFPDGRDLNRVFPGSTSGSLAGRVAHKLIHSIVPYVDIIIDFHTGGAGRFNAPQLRYVKEDHTLNNLAKVFAAPFVLYSKNVSKSFRAACYKLDKTLLLFEGGKSFHIDNTVTNCGVNGSKRVLKHFNMLQSKFKIPKPKQNCIFIEDSKWIRAKYSGMFKPSINTGLFVNKNDILGNITDPYGKFDYAVKAKHSGFIINVNEAPIVYQGDALFHISLTHN